MGPYVLRSIGAHFKLWDEGVQDSFTENLAQAPANDVLNISTNCQCTNSSGACGSAQAGTQCGANQRVINHNCDPQLCDGAPASSCVNDPTCCTAWVNAGCGTIPIGGTPPSNNCNYGYEIQVQQCGTNNTVQCVPNSNCDPKCLGVVTQGAVACPGALTGLTQNYGITYVQTDSQADCAKTSNCTTYCDPAGNTKCQYYASIPTGCKNPPIFFPGPSGAHNGIFVPSNGSLSPDAICKAYGFTRGGYAQIFPYPMEADETSFPSAGINACVNSSNPQTYFVSATQPSSWTLITLPSGASGCGNTINNPSIFPYTFNGQTAYWAIVENCNQEWTHVWCLPNNSDSSASPDNATVCNNETAPSGYPDQDPQSCPSGYRISANVHPDYYSVVNSCGFTPCTVTCNPGYGSTPANWSGVPFPTGCEKQ